MGLHFNVGLVVFYLCSYLILSTNGGLQHLWTFDDDYIDVISGLSALVGAANATRETEGSLCGTHYVSTGGTAGSVVLKDVNLNVSADFMIALWVYVPEKKVGLVPLLTQLGCSQPTLRLEVADGIGLILTYDTGLHLTKLASNYSNLVGSWNLISFGRSGNKFALCVNGITEGFVELNEPPAMFVINDLVLGGTSGCETNSSKNYFDEVMIFDLYYDPRDLNRDKCVQRPPMPILQYLAPNHTSFSVYAQSFFFQLAPPNLTFTLNGVVMISRRYNVSISPDETYAIILRTDWIFSKQTVVSPPIYILPMGELRYAWSFEGDYTDIVGNNSRPSSQNALPGFAAGICGQALETSNNTAGRSSLNYALETILYKNDFTISFWMRLYGERNGTYAILGQRKWCSPMDGWDLRYYGNQRLTFELFSTYGNGGWMTLQADVTGLRFFEDWQHITITRELYTVKMHINGTVVVQETMYMNPNISHPLAMSEDPCIMSSDSDPTLQAPKLLYDELLIFDVFVPPQNLFKSPCIREIPSPVVSANETHFVVKQFPVAPYHSYATIYYVLRSQFDNETTSTADPTCFGASGCVIPRAYKTLKYTFWTVALFLFGSISSAPVESPAISSSCEENNGGCDYRVNCTMGGNNSVLCGECPFGTHADGNKCTSFCGNGYCQPEHGETCVNCFFDCAQTHCGECGDSLCDESETCKSCPEDCSCSPPEAIQCPECNHGSCVSGECHCESPWTGVDCNSRIQTMTPNVDLTKPEIMITTPDESTNMFYIGVRAIRELDANKNVLRSVIVPNLNFSAHKQEVSTALNIYNYNATLDNAAQINIIVSMFHASTSVTFAGITKTLPAESMKIGVTIQHWPFFALSNFLEIVFESFPDKDRSSNNIEKSFSGNGTLKAISIDADKYSLYAQFEEKAVLDGRVRTIFYTLNESDHSVSASLPHFWQSADIDPQYNVLLDSEKGKQKKDLNLIIILLPTIVGVILVVVFLAVGINKLHAYIVAKRSFREIQLQN